MRIKANQKGYKMQLQGSVELDKPALLAALELVASAESDQLPRILSVGSEIVVGHAMPIRRETFNDLTYGLGMVIGAARAIQLQMELSLGGRMTEAAARPTIAAQATINLVELVKMIETAGEWSNAPIASGGDLSPSAAIAAYLAAVLVAGAAARRMLDILADMPKFYAETEGETFQ